jgi:hypothetical protein
MHKQLIDYLTPLLGQETAANMLKHYCARMNLAFEDLQASHLPEIAVAMKPMLAVWLGSTGATQVAEEIAKLGRKARAG